MLVKHPGDSTLASHLHPSEIHLELWQTPRYDLTIFTQWERDMPVWIWLAILGVVAITALLVAVIKSCLHESAWQQQLWNSMSAYDATHPPITDEEFLKLCGPDVSPEVALKVREIIAEVGCIEKSRIYPDARIVQDLGLC